MDAIKTKDFRAFLDAVKCDGKAVVITPEMRETVIKSARNLPGVMTTTAKILSVYDILNAKYLVIDQSALAIIEEVFCVMTAYDIIIRPIITERSMASVADKKYVFEVAPSAGKIEIKKAIEEIFGVKVAAVNTTDVHGQGQAYGAARPAAPRIGRRLLCSWLRTQEH